MSDARLASLRTHHAEVLAAALAKQVLGAACNFDAPQRSETLAPATRLCFDCHSELECCEAAEGETGCHKRLWHPCELAADPACCDVDAGTEPRHGGRLEAVRGECAGNGLAFGSSQEARRAARRGDFCRPLAASRGEWLPRNLWEAFGAARRDALATLPAEPPSLRHLLGARLLGDSAEARRRAPPKVVEMLRRELRDGGATAEGAAAACDAGAVLRAAERAVRAHLLPAPAPPRLDEVAAAAKQTLTALFAPADNQTLTALFAPAAAAGAADKSPKQKGKSEASGVGSLVNMNTFVPSLIFLMTFCLADSQDPFPIATLPILKWIWLFMGVVSLMASGRQSQFNPCTHLPGASCPT